MSEPTLLGLRRILVALDGSGHSEAALEAAARLAAIFDAELLGIYVEDETVLSVASHPFAVEVGRFGGTPTGLTATSLRRQFHAQGERARRAFEWAVRQRRLRSRFDVVAGSVGDELVRAAEAADLITVGQSGSISASRQKIGTTTRTVLARAVGPVLVLRRGLRFDLPVVVLYDFDADDRNAALDIGHALSLQDRMNPLVVLVEAPDPIRRKEAEAAIRSRLGRDASRVRLEPVRCDHAAEVVSRAHTWRAGVLVVPAGSRGVTGDRLNDLVSMADMPVMIVRGRVGRG